MRRDGWVDRTTGKKKSVKRWKRGLEQREQRQSTSYKFPRKISYCTVLLKRGASHQNKRTRISCILHACHDRFERSIERRPMKRFKRPRLAFLLFCNYKFMCEKNLFSFPAILCFPSHVSKNLCKTITTVLCLLRIS